MCFVITKGPEIKACKAIKINQYEFKEKIVEKKINNSELMNFFSLMLDKYISFSCKYTKPWLTEFKPWLVPNYKTKNNWGKHDFKKKK